jgi:23S rRNA pseudouridine2457 synthase
MPLVLLNKPCQVLCQFRDPDGRATLADYVDTPNVYPAGRLDYDSEGLLLLTDDGRLQAKISQPCSQTPKTYWAQVEGEPTTAQIDALLRGVDLKDGRARADAARLIDAPEDLWPRQPPIRYRANVPDHWIEITISEGRNRQVRRMTAAVGLPTLRLIRSSVGPWALDGLPPGATRVESNAVAWSRFSPR